MKNNGVSGHQVLAVKNFHGLGGGNGGAKSGLTIGIGAGPVVMDGFGPRIKVQIKMVLVKLPTKIKIFTEEKIFFIPPANDFPDFSFDSQKTALTGFNFLGFGVGTMIIEITVENF